MQNDRLTSYAFFDELAEALKAKSASVVKNSNGIREIVSAPLAGAFANSDGMGAITLSNQTVLFPRASSLPIMGTNVAEELLTGANRIAQGGDLSYGQENAFRTLWHEFLHNQQRQTAMTDDERRIAEMLTEWTARQTYPMYIESLGGRASHWEQMKKLTPSGYQDHVRNFSTLGKALGVNDAELIKDVRQVFEDVGQNGYLDALADALAARTGIERRTIKGMLSRTEWDKARFRDFINAGRRANFGRKG